MNLGRALGAAALVGAAVLLPRSPGAAEPSSTQQIVVSAAGYGSTSGTLTAYQYSDGVWHVVVGPARAELGAHGLSDNRSEGDGTTPTGTYGFGDTLYGLADAAPNGRYAYHHLVCGDWWSGVRDSTYNTFQHIDCGQTMDNSEALWQQTVAYQHFAVIDFNTNPTVIGRGSAIFLHDATSSGVTAGCVAIAPNALDAVLGWLDPAQHPVIRIGTKSQVGPPSPMDTPTAPTPPRPRPARAAPTSPPARVVAPTTTRPPPPPPTTAAPTTTTSTSTTLAAVLAAPATVVIRSTAGGDRSSKALGAVAAGVLLVDVAGFGLWVRRLSPAGS